MNLATQVRTKARAVAMTRVRSTPRDDLVRVGDWWVPETLLGCGSVCYAAGDDGFDVALMERFGCKVAASTDHLGGIDSAGTVTLRTLMGRALHSHIDLLILDAAAVGRRVVESMLWSDVLPTVVCVSLPAELWQAWTAVMQLRAAGYTVVRVDGFDVTLVREGHLSGSGLFDAPNRV